MAVRSKTRSSAAKHPAVKTTKRQAVEAIFEEEGLPGWLGWGTMGAESTWGSTASGHFFGLIEPSYSGVAPNNNWAHDAKIAAHLYKQLVAENGSVAAAVPHYSGNSYTVGHVEELGKPKSAGSSQGAESVNADFLGGLGEVFGLGGPIGQAGAGAGESGSQTLEHGAEHAEAIGAPISQGWAAITAFLSMITDINFWIRVGEGIGAFILIYIALKELV